MPPLATYSSRLELLVLLGGLVIGRLVIRSDSANVSLDIPLRSFKTDSVGELCCMISLDLGHKIGVSHVYWGQRLEKSAHLVRAIKRRISCAIKDIVEWFTAFWRLEDFGESS